MVFAGGGRDVDLAEMEFPSDSANKDMRADDSWSPRSTSLSILEALHWYDAVFLQ